jgi:hypothetical protein
MSKARPPVKRLTAREADRLYRLRNGSAALAWRAGLIEGVEVKSSGCTGKKLLLRADDCEAVLPTLGRELETAGKS